MTVVQTGQSCWQFCSVKDSTPPTPRQLNRFCAYADMRLFGYHLGFNRVKCPDAGRFRLENDAAKAYKESILIDALDAKDDNLSMFRAGLDAWPQLAGLLACDTDHLGAIIDDSGDDDGTNGAKQGLPRSYDLRFVRMIVNLRQGRPYRDRRSFDSGSRASSDGR